MWDARHRAYDATRALRPGTSALTTDVAVPVSALADTILRTRADLDEHGLTGSILGHVGDGNFHVTLLIDRDDPADCRPRRWSSTTAWCAARSTPAARAPASTGSATARRATSSSSTAPRAWR